MACCGRVLADGVHHYAFFNREREKIADAVFLDTKAFEGAQLKYTWRELEREKDRYDFSAIRHDLTFLRSKGKRLFVQLQDVSFSPTVANVPAYLRNDPRSGGGADKQYNIPNDDEAHAVPEGWVARRWDPAVQERFHRRLSVLGKEFDGQIEGINLAESAVDFGESGRLFPKRFAPAAYRDAVVGNMEALKQAFPKSVTLQYVLVRPSAFLFREGDPVPARKRVKISTRLRFDRFDFAIYSGRHERIDWRLGNRFSLILRRREQQSPMVVYSGPRPMTASAQSATSPAEQAAVKFIDDHNADALALLECVVNINSGTGNHDGVKAVGQVFRAEFDALGLETTWVDGAGFRRAGHLVADHPGPGPRVLLIGHLDTVFEKDSPFQRFERLDAHTAKGPGILDMKGGDVVMLQALKAIQAAGALHQMNVIVVLTGDEEEGGRPLAQSRASLVKAATGARYAVGFENGDNNLAHAISARRGIQGWELRVKSKTGHSSQVFTEVAGDGAIFEAVRILNAFRDKLGREPHLTFNPGVIGGGTTVEYESRTATVTSFGKTNVIAAEAVVIGDLRALTADQFAKSEAAMEAIVRGAPSATTTASITFGERYPPLAPTPGNGALLAAYSQASQDLGFGTVTAVSPDRAGAADVSFIGDQVKGAIDAVGMKGGGEHSPAEYADLRSLAIQAKRAAVTLLRLRE